MCECGMGGACVSVVVRGKGCVYVCMNENVPCIV